MPAPLIGITTYHSANPQGNPILALVEAYVQAVAQAGGLPVLLPLGLPEPQLLALLARLDGLIFSGGGDIDPVCYGMPADSHVNSVDPDRDRVELFLVRQACQSATPFLGICRGLQVINVALGGTLYTHLSDQHPQAIKHDYYPDWLRTHLAHAVSIAPSSRLAEILGGGALQVNSLHHQGVRDLAPGLRPLAWAPDGLVEAFTLPDHPFGLAVQWHPEWLTAYAPMRALFESLVEAAR